jgi:adenylate cyclase class 2
MQYEVENKFPVAHLSAMERQLSEMGAQFREVIEQVDVYFAHPVRDFAETDEALRIRRVGEMNFVTYKGPKIDQTTKTRREIELPLVSGAERVADYTALLVALGFRTVAEVRKRRRGGQLAWHDWTVELALDEVAQLGQFVELEIVVEPDRLTDAQTAVRLLAERLGLAQPERRSYLELVLDATR